MPIVDIELVCEPADPRLGVAAPLAHALGQVFGSAPGRTWVRLRSLSPGAYAENDCAPGPDALPVFVTVLHARPPQDDALQREIASVTQAVAKGVGVASERVHVQYAPPAAGRQAFGGTLVR